MTGESGAFQPIEPPQFLRVRRACYMLSGALCLAFLIAVHAYGRYGGPFVNNIDDQLGQVLTERAASLYHSGLPEAAVEMYKKALQGRFASPEQKMWTCRRLADILLELERWDEAAQAYESVLVLKEGPVELYSRLCLAYRKLGKKDLLLDAAERWKAAAQGISEDQVKAAQAIIEKEGP